MAGDLPPNLDEGSTIRPPTSGQWPASYPGQSTRLARNWPATVLAAIAVLLGAAALVVALTRPTNGPAAVSATTSAAPAYTAEETAAAHKKLCDVYKVAARAVQIETNGSNSERAGIATVNGAVMLEEAVNSTPTMTPGDRGAALALAEAYSKVSAVSSLALGSNDPEWQSALSDANAKDAAMKKVCGGG